MSKSKVGMSIWLIGIAMMVLFSACVDDNYDFNNLDTTIQVDTKVVAPLVYSRLQLSDLLADSLDGLGLQVKDDAIYIVHRDSQYLGNDLISNLACLPTGSFTFKLAVGEVYGNIDQLPVQVNEGEISYTEEFSFDGLPDDANERVDSILMGECYADLQVHTYHLIPIENSYIEIHFYEDEIELNPELYPENKVYFPLQAEEDDTYFNAQIDLTGAKLRFIKKDEAGNFLFHAEIRGHIVSSVPFDSGTEIDLEVKMDHMRPHLTYLNIGTERDIYENELTIDFDYTKDFQQDNAFFPFYDPQIAMTCLNNIGIPVRYYIDYVEAMDTRTGEKVRADFGGENPDTMSIVVNTPSFAEIEHLTDQELLSYDVSQLVKTSELTFNREFGHTDRLFKINPNKLTYHYRIRSVDNNRNNVHFFFYDSDMWLTEEATMQLRFEGDAQNPDKNFFLSRTDSVPFLDEPVDMGSVSFDERTHVALKLSYKNFLPVGVQGHIAYLDANGNRILTDAEQSFKIVAGKVDSEGYVVESTDQSEAISIAFEYGEVKTLLSEVKTLLFSYKMANDELKTITLRTNDWLELKANLYFDGAVVLDFNNMEENDYEMY